MDEGIRAGNCVLVKNDPFYNSNSQSLSEWVRAKIFIFFGDGYFIPCDAILKAINHLSNPSVYWEIKLNV